MKDKPDPIEGQLREASEAMARLSGRIEAIERTLGVLLDHSPERVDALARVAELNCDDLGWLPATFVVPHQTGFRDSLKNILGNTVR